MPLDEAKGIARRLLGSFPSADPPDHETYLTELVVLFLKYPHWAGEQTLGRLKGGFLPSVPEVKMILEDQVRIHRAAAEWKAGAAALLSGPDVNSLEYRERMRGKFGGLADELRTQGAAQSIAEAAAGVVQKGRTE